MWIDPGYVRAFAFEPSKYERQCIEAGLEAWGKRTKKNLFRVRFAIPCKDKCNASLSNAAPDSSDPQVGTIFYSGAQFHVGAYSGTLEVTLRGQRFFVERGQYFRAVRIHADRCEIIA